MAYTKFWFNCLKRQLAKNQIIEIDRRPVTKELTTGYLVGLSDQCLVLHLITDDYLLNGYAAFPLTGIKRYRVVTKWNRIMARAMAARKLSPVSQPRIELTDMPSLLKSANKLFPLVTIHRERIADDACWIGKVGKMTEKTFELHEIDPGAKFYVTRRYRFADVTLVAFGGEYEKALWRVHEGESKKSRRKVQQ
jgi:hypothetical protein